MGEKRMRGGILFEKQGDTFVPIDPPKPKEEKIEDKDNTPKRGIDKHPIGLVSNVQKRDMSTKKVITE
jgi:hypothetical protein